jgi:hypothetical protein
MTYNPQLNLDWSKVNTMQQNTGMPVLSPSGGGMTGTASGLGGMVGLLGGPVGALAGTAIGAGIGAIGDSITADKERKQREKERQDMLKQQAIENAQRNRGLGQADRSANQNGMQMAAAMRGNAYDNFRNLMLRGGA